MILILFIFFILFFYFYLFIDVFFVIFLQVNDSFSKDLLKQIVSCVTIIIYLLWKFKEFVLQAVNGMMQPLLKVTLKGIEHHRYTSRNNVGMRV